ncbi:MAG: SIMPL domain-containing protein [Flavobacteriales bacterium]|nr:SIMPL domain-containing protein [Flavobacteriales bacterium]
MKHINAIIFGLAIVVAAGLLGNAYVERSQLPGKISVTGLGEIDFSSDLIVWEANFSTEAWELKDAYSELNQSKEGIKAYLLGKGIPESSIVFTAVNTRKNTRTIYSDDGRYRGEEFTGYILTQAVKIESEEVDKVELVSREVTELLNQGIQLYSLPPRYYYSKLADLKIELISKATEDAHSRAERIAQNSGSSLGELNNAKMGIFQITGQNSNEDYSWGGTFNTTDREKTASITVRLEYDLDG